MYKKSLFLKKDVRVFGIICTVLIIIGLVFVYSSSCIYAQELHANQFYYVTKQLIGLLLGIICFMGIQLIPFTMIKKAAIPFFLFTLLATSATLIPYFSHRIHGSHRWLSLGSYSFQPSELLKIGFLLYLALFLSRRMHRQPSFNTTYLPFFFIVIFIACILLKQPDFGLTITLIATGLLLLCIGQFHISSLLYALSTFTPLVVALIIYKPYRIKRILTFLDPWSDPQGAGFQIIQSLIAIGSGGWGGTGISHSKQKFFYLPMQHTDFIFSIIAEETGFIGSFIIIGLLVFFTYFGIKIALQMKDPFCIFFTLGFTILTSLQAIINLMVTVGLVPTKGVGLPFVSYGNSALLCNIIMLGVVFRMVKQ